MSDPEFQKAYEEQNQRDYITNATIATVIQIPLNLFCSLMDYVVYPEKWLLFLKARVCSVLLVGLAWLFYRIPRGNTPRRLGVVWIMSPLVMILWMIYEANAPYSPYYAGLNIILLGMGLLTPWAFRQNLLVTIFVVVMYVLVSLAMQTPQPIASIINNTTFLILTAVIVVASSRASARQREREFTLRWELEKNRQQLEESNRKLTELDQIKGRFFANISHELRTPLTLIISPLETILARFRGTLDADTVGLLQTMQSNGLRLLKLINDLLDLVRLDSGVMQVKREPIALDEFLQGMASAARQVANDKEIQLVVSVAPDLGLAMVDRDKLEKIVLNLLFNALKFTPAKGRVELRMDRKDGKLVLKVSDTGIGIPKDKLPQMFQRFMQVDASSRRKYQGVGIGLALVKELVEVQSGTVGVESVEGQGSTFTVSLPYFEAPPDSVPATAPTLHALANEASSPAADGNGSPGQTRGTVASQEWLSNLYHRANLFGTPVTERNVAPSSGEGTGKTHARTVLVADDQPDMLRFLKSELAPHYNIIEATDGQQAVDRAAGSLPDIVLLDMMMPEKDGIQAAREIRAAPATQNVPIVLITAHVDEETKLNALRAGASDFLPKPFSTTELHVRVKNLLDAHEFQRMLALQNTKLAETIELLKQTETQLVQSEKVASLGRLSAGIIHEINNPLNFASTGLYVLKNQGQRLAAQEPAEFSEVLRDVEEGLQRVKNIVSDLRSFTHPDAQQMDIVKVTDVITSSLRLLSNEWKEKVQIDQAVPSDLVCRANKNKLTQVFVNLIQNSLDALKNKPIGPEPPVIRLSGRQEDGTILICIRDNGEGVEPQNLSKMFDPFYTTRDIGKGMGMGLSICYRIIQELNGTITVASERGKFCEFVIKLPAATEESIAA